MSSRRLFVPIGFLLSAGSPLLAHDPGLSTAEVRFAEDNRLTLSMTFARADVLSLARLSPEDVSELEEPHLRERLERLSAGWTNLVVLRAGARRLLPAAADFDLEGNAGSDNVGLNFSYRIESGVPSYSLRIPALERLPRGHRQFVTVRGRRGEVLTQRLLQAGSDSVSFSAQRERESSLPSFGRFVALGIEHILTGYDHLLFLLGFLVIGPRLKESLKIVTAFTLAHSTTLALAAFQVVRLPAQWVEPLIAASIACVGIENLLRKRSPARRWSLAFGFGLIHGLGFASALTDLGVGREGGNMLLPLFSFNLGVEAGQLAVLALTIPALLLLAQRPSAMLRVARLGSAAVSAAGLYWLVERVLA